jgi:hypothetical protein
MNCQPVVTLDTNVILNVSVGQAAENQFPKIEDRDDLADERRPRANQAVISSLHALTNPRG